MRSCLDYALYYISRYPKTEKELRIQLMQKGYFSDDINQAIEFLKEKNFLNDRMFVESYIRSELVNKGKPFAAVLKKLQIKGADKHLIAEVVQEYQDDITQGVRTKIKKEIDVYKRKGVDGFDIIQKLMCKGYRLDDIKAVIKGSN